MIGRFFNYIEIKTKITSIFAFLMTIAYVYYIGRPINWKLTSIFFASMFIFDLTTTAINNYIDTKTNHQTLAFSRKTAFIIILILLAVSTALGVYLAYLTDIVVLLVGALCFICGILYTFGPVPISRQPLGELLSGVFYGLLIPFIILYINLPAGTYLTLNINLQSISLNINVMPVITVILLSFIPMFTTANIMLANNICDLERDIKAKRHTLPYYLGKWSLDLFAGMYYLIYFDMAIMVLLKILSPICLLIFLTLITVQKNIKQFFKLQDKEKTFIVSIKNYILIMGSSTLLIFISGLVR